MHMCTYVPLRIYQNTRRQSHMYIYRYVSFYNLSKLWNLSDPRRSRARVRHNLFEYIHIIGIIAILFCIIYEAEVFTFANVLSFRFMIIDSRRTFEILYHFWIVRCVKLCKFPWIVNDSIYYILYDNITHNSFGQTNNPQSLGEI